VLAPLRELGWDFWAVALALAALMVLGAYRLTRPLEPQHLPALLGHVDPPRPTATPTPTPTPRPTPRKASPTP